jgi:RNA polymerase sigma-70 factor, ECF subfamily
MQWAAVQRADDAPESDEALVAKLRAGDAPAFDLLYERYFKRVYHFVDKRLRNRADSEETTQEVFINIFSSIDSYRGEAAFAAWVFGLTRRTIAARYKRRRHATVPLDSEEAERGASTSRAASTAATPLEVYEYNERLAQMDAAMQSCLSEEQRVLFRMHHLDDQPIGDIARQLAKSEDAVKSNLYRTRRLLMSR